MIIVTLIPLLIFFAILYLRFNKGKIAEKMVHHKLMQLPEEYHVIDNVLFMSNGRSTQIDHIVVSPYAVFVIETKGYKGWIFGGESTEYWTQNIYGHKSTFYSPLLQNDGHVRFLKFMLKVNVNTHIVVNRCCLKDAILQYKIPAISQEIKEKIISIIESNSKTLEKGATCEHKYNALRKQYDSQNKIQHGVCPRCGGRLVERQGRYGCFFGCSNYPRCKFTSNR